MSTLLTFPARAVAFWTWFVGQIVTSSWAIIVDILTTGHTSTPRVVRLRLTSTDDHQVALIGILITLTPGTLTLGVTEDDGGARTLLVHSLYHGSTEAALADLQEMERRMLRGTTIGGTG
ncbi:putative monovalent cation/H+ antiporter subunit E [Aeromicrobium marinum DSM 15272]|uniref:Monovalent cation/H+ antiporter subunit E n=1 Tax=Aeromicrobium marinum DSM 15272 TaxID=585531 RepID=E2SFZ5_9ACTN|nr:Na+/H+ antiporter subunit E [Aeromicrobium marinum]EFQ81942.1 putative monovalent cation/H+ antiporter subunit E [Aeromicrobium marinum DSM 15272]